MTLPTRSVTKADRKITYYQPSGRWYKDDVDTHAMIVQELLQTVESVKSDSAIAIKSTLRQAVGLEEVGETPAPSIMLLDGNFQGFPDNRCEVCAESSHDGVDVYCVDEAVPDAEGNPLLDRGCYYCLIKRVSCSFAVDSRTGTRDRATMPRKFRDHLQAELKPVALELHEWGASGRLDQGDSGTLGRVAGQIAAYSKLLSEARVKGEPPVNSPAVVDGWSLLASVVDTPGKGSHVTSPFKTPRTPARIRTPAPSGTFEPILSPSVTRRNAVAGPSKPTPSTRLTDLGTSKEPVTKGRPIKKAKTQPTRQVPSRKVKQSS